MFQRRSCRKYRTILVKTSTAPIDNATLMCPVTKNDTTMVSSVPVARHDAALTILRIGLSVGMRLRASPLSPRDAVESRASLAMLWQPKDRIASNRVCPVNRSHVLNNRQRHGVKPPLKAPKRKPRSMPRRLGPVRMLTLSQPVRSCSNAGQTQPAGDGASAAKRAPTAASEWRAFQQDATNLQADSSLMSGRCWHVRPVLMRS